MKKKMEQKEGKREMRRMEDRSLLLILTRGVSCCLMKIPKAQRVAKEKKSAKDLRLIPRWSSEDRKIVIELFSSGHPGQSSASEKQKSNLSPLHSNFSWFLTV